MFTLILGDNSLKFSMRGKVNHLGRLNFMEKAPEMLSCAVMLAASATVKKPILNAVSFSEKPADNRNRTGGWKSFIFSFNWTVTYQKQYFNILLISAIVKCTPRVAGSSTPFNTTHRLSIVNEVFLNGHQSKLELLICGSVPEISLRRTFDKVFSKMKPTSSNCKAGPRSCITSFSPGKRQ